VASNENPRKKIAPFLSKLLKELQAVCSVAQDESSMAEDRILVKLCDFGTKRMKAYRHLMQSPLKRCREILGLSCQDDGKSNHCRGILPQSAKDIT
jgi:hypothetical protein